MNDFNTRLLTIQRSLGQTETKFDQLSKKVFKKLKSLQQKQKDQESISKKLSAADIKNNCKFDDIMTELQTASDFIQYQTDVFSEKVKNSEATCDAKINEMREKIERQFKDFTDILFKKQEEYEKSIGLLRNDVIEDENVDIESLSLMKMKESLVKFHQHNKNVFNILSDTSMSGLSPASLKNATVLDEGSSDQLNSKSSNLPTEWPGHLETQFSNSAETDPRRYVISCKKLSHEQFFPVNEFAITHLPEGYHDMDLFYFIKAAANLTVRVDVKLTSPCAPKLWTKSSVDSNPIFTTGRNADLTTGSGTLSSGLYKFNDGYDERGDKNDHNAKCWCKNCLHSDTASHVWWEFYVVSATRLVFKNDDASNTSLRLFYDTKESPVVTIDQVSVDNVGGDSDWCWMKCVTCDRKLADKLTLLWGRFEDVKKIVCEKFRQSRDADKLAFIVSHPHGLPKQISLGHWVEKYELDNALTRFTYTTCTCPGSAGASVHCVGYDGYQLVHNGSFKPGLNYSGTGRVW